MIASTTCGSGFVCPSGAKEQISASSLQGERLSASLGQIVYFDDSRVTQGGEAPVERGGATRGLQPSGMPSSAAKASS